MQNIRMRMMQPRRTAIDQHDPSEKHAQAQTNGLTAERDAARAAQVELRDSLGKLEQEKVQLTAALESARKPDNRIEQAVTRAEGMEKDLKAESARRATAEAGLVQANEQVAALTKAKTDAERDAAAASEAQAGLRATIARLEQEKTQLAAAQNTSEETKQQLAGLSAKSSATEKQAASLRQERDALSAKLTEMAGEIAQLRDDRERMQKLLADSGKKLRDSADSASHIKNLEARAAGLQSSLAALSSEASQAKQQVAALTKAKEDAEAQANSLTSERDAARTTQNELHETIARLEQEKKQLAGVQNSAPAYPDLSGKVRELEAQVAATHQQAETAAQTADATSRQSTADLAAATEQIAQLKGALAAKSSAPAYPDLSGKVSELESTMADSARQLAAAGSAQVELQRQLADATTALQNAAKPKSNSEDQQLRRERDELSGRVTDLAGEVAQLRADRERMQKLLADSGKQLRDSTADASRIKELEAQVSSNLSTVTSAKAEASQAKEQISALTKAKEETQAQVTSLQGSLAAKSAAPAYPDLSGKVSELETQLGNLQTALAAKPAAPSYPDLSGRVSELEAQLAAPPKRSNAPVYPNLAGRVVELETALADSKRQLTDTQTALHAAEQAKAAPVAAEANPTDLQKQLADTEDKLATALRGYALLEHERDAQTAKANQAAEVVTTERNTLASQVATLTTEVEQLKAGSQSSSGASQAEISRLNESLSALQRSTAQNTSDLAATRALLQQMQGANAVLAGENYQLKTMLARSTGGPGPVRTAPAALPAARTHVVASGDSLSRISQRYYGTANRWQEIYNANRDKISSDGLLRIGTELRIP